MQTAPIMAREEAFASGDEFAPVFGDLLEDCACGCGLGGREAEGDAFPYSLLDV